MLTQILKQSLALLLASTLATSAFAQTTTEQPAEPVITIPPAPAEAPAEPDFVTETFGDWEVRCTPDRSNCFMFQVAKDSDDNSVAEFSIIALPEASEAKAGATVVTPLGTLLTAGLSLQVDTGQVVKYPFNWCARAGCVARFGLSDDDVSVLKRGGAATLTLVSVSAPDKPVVLKVSLSGITAAFDSLTK